MFNSKMTLFTIGQFAALHGINKKTLMWYDEVKLLKPAVIKENGYRYYTYHQSSTLETILMLRGLDVSIPEIQVFLENRSAAQLEMLLEEKLAGLDNTIAHLKAVRKTLLHKKKEAQFLLQMDLSDICIAETEERYLAVVNTNKQTSLEKEIELVIQETRKLPFHRLHNACYGSMISVDSLRRGEYDDYCGLFIEAPASSARRGLHLRPKGRYLKAFCKGSWDKLPARYEVLLEYARERGITLQGYAYEKGINETVIRSMDEYITQIEIPVLE